MLSVQEELCAPRQRVYGFTCTSLRILCQTATRYSKALSTTHGQQSLHIQGIHFSESLLHPLCCVRTHTPTHYARYKMHLHDTWFFLFGNIIIAQFGVFIFFAESDTVTSLGSNVLKTIRSLVVIFTADVIFFLSSVSVEWLVLCFVLLRDLQLILSTLWILCLKMTVPKTPWNFTTLRYDFAFVCPCFGTNQ